MDKTQDKERIRIIGSVEEIIYRSDKNDYTVIELITDTGEKLVAVGAMPFIAEGEEAVLYGRYITHAEYGRQFLTELYEKKLPTGAVAILKYLSSGTVRGVGPATATKIVERYGEDAFDVIENHPEWLSDIGGISPRKAKEIHDSFCEQSGIRSLMLFCRDFFGSSVIARIYKEWGKDSVPFIRQNPYRLCREIYGIGFDRADALAEGLGIEKEANERLIAGLIYLLHHNSSANGHLCLPKEKLIAAAVTLLGVEEHLILYALELALKEKQLVSVALESVSYLYLPETAEDEQFVADKLLRLDAACPAFDYEDIDRLVEAAELASGITYAAMQKSALYEAMRSGIMVLTGGPGTGKTTVIKGLLGIFRDLGMRVALAAPTGRAAKRMSEATGAEAATVHRLLEASRGESYRPKYERNHDNPLSEDVIIVDEASMMDLTLASAFLDAVKIGARVIFVGDANQLPSVGAGSFLWDMIDSGVLNTVELDEIFRQSGESLIITNAHAVNDGQMPSLSVKDNDFFFLPRREDAIADTVVDLIARRLPKAYGEGILDRIQVITPSRKGRCGTEALNPLLQAALNPPAADKKELSLRERVFRTGDKVMQIRNNYRVEWAENTTDADCVFNGDIGTVEEVDPAGEWISVRYDGYRLALYRKGEYDELEHAYAITVHKSQGSEYGTIILPLYSCPPMLMTRNLLYTAVTRARERVILVGREDIIGVMVENNRHFFRYSLLKNRLMREIL